MKSRTSLSVLFLLLIFNSQTSFSQAKDSPTSQMDFMIGQWDLYSNGSMMGKSVVDTILNSHAIQEDFTEFPPDPFLGKSWITYNANAAQWEMTSVDNQGHHSFFIGKWKESKMVLERNFKNLTGEDRIQRLTYLNISKNAFDWTFDVSTDNGKTWNVLYNVHYARKS